MDFMELALMWREVEHEAAINFVVFFNNERHLHFVHTNGRGIGSIKIGS
jgi:hypothetical protein